MKIIFDIDGTMTDYRAYIDHYALPWFYRKYGLLPQKENELELEDILDLQNVIQAQKGCTVLEAANEEKEMLNRFWFSHRFIRFSLLSQLRTGRASAIRALKRLGGTVEIYTSRAYAVSRNFAGFFVRFCTAGQLWINGIGLLKIHYFQNDKDMQTFLQIQQQCLQENVTYANQYLSQNGRTMKKNLIQRLTMPLPELEAYYCERRKYQFTQGKSLRYIRLRKVFYPLFAKFLMLDRTFRRQTITVLGKRKNIKEPIIYACSHIGENDLENIYEVLHQGCWWFVGDPCVLYKSISGLLVYLNRCIMLETDNKEDRQIAYLRAVELLKGGGSLMIFPEGARNGTENLPVMELFPGTAKMAMETNTKIVPIAIEQYGTRFVINFGSELCPENFQNYVELTQTLRDVLATLKWEIWEREPLQLRDRLPENYGELFIKEFEARIHPYDTLETIEQTRYHGKISTPEEVFAHLRQLIPCKENAFLFRKNWNFKN